MIYSSFDLISDCVCRFRTVGVSAVRAESHSPEASPVSLTRNHRFSTIEQLLAQNRARANADRCCYHQELANFSTAALDTLRFRGGAISLKLGKSFCHWYCVQATHDCWLPH